MVDMTANPAPTPAPPALNETGQMLLRPSTTSLSCDARPSKVGSGCRRVSTLLTGPRGGELIERNFNAELMAVMNSCPDNRHCADCRDELGTDAWASLNLGIFICIRCCGVHRSLGTHVTKCQSVDLDKWTPEQVAGMTGNRHANAQFEAHIPCGRFRPTCRDPMALCADWIRAKYCQRAFEKPSSVNATLDSYELEARTAHIAIRENGLAKRAQTRLYKGVLLAIFPRCDSPCQLVVLRPGMEAISKTLLGASTHQDRPVDSRIVQLIGKRGNVLLEFEADSTNDLVVWLKALRGSISLGNADCGVCGWLSVRVGKLHRRRRCWCMLHSSGLYCFKTCRIGNTLPEAACLRLAENSSPLREEGDCGLRYILPRDGIITVQRDLVENPRKFSIETVDQGLYSIKVDEAACPNKWFDALKALCLPTATE